MKLYETGLFQHRYIIHIYIFYMTIYEYMKIEREEITLCDSCLCVIMFLLPELEKVSLDLVVGSILVWLCTLFITLGDAELWWIDAGVCDLSFVALPLVEVSGACALVPEDPTGWCEEGHLCLGAGCSPFMEEETLPWLLGAESARDTGWWWG